MKATSPFQIVIVGGGIAGLTAAIALRAPNRRIIVLEQSRLNTEIGALISLQPNASKIVSDVFGLGKELEDARGMVACGMNGWRLHSRVQHGGSGTGLPVNFNQPTNQPSAAMSVTVAQSNRLA